MLTTILHSSEDQLKNAQAKITYLGEQHKPIATVMFVAQGYAPSLKRFIEFQRNTHEAYPNDELPYTKKFDVSPQEFRRILSAIEPIVAKEDGSKSPDFLSFCVVRRINGGYDGREFFIKRTFGEQFYKKLIDALDRENEAGRTILNKQFKNLFP